MCRQRGDGAAKRKNDQLLKHIYDLGLGSVDEYREWCSQYGFSRKLHKHSRVRMKEHAHVARQKAYAKLVQRKREMRMPQQLIRQIFAGKVDQSQLTVRHTQLLYEAYKMSMNNRHTKRHLLELMLHVSRSCSLLQRDPVYGELVWQEGNSIVEGLVALARYWPCWIRPVEDWKPRSHNAYRQFTSLARHLFARWPVPTFMDAVWFKGCARQAERQQRWFVHLGKGENIRHANLPIPYTKRMAHHFMQAPSWFTPANALRYGQIIALGGDARLVDAIVGSRLGDTFVHDKFWLSVIRWFIAHPLLDRAHVGPIVDYIHHQKFVDPYARFWNLDDNDRRRPPHPNFSMKGRTPETLLRQVDEWHHLLALFEQPPAEWNSSGFSEFEYVEGNAQSGNQKIWTIKELLTSKALNAEGRRMKHCVGTYAGSCANGICSIWTVEVESVAEKRKALTVEVRNRSRVICQVRGKRNTLPNDKEMGVLRRWATQAGLTVTSFL